MMRLHPASSRVAQLSVATPASLVVFDALAVGELDLRAVPFAERRARLAELLNGAPSPLVLTPLTDSVEVARAWLEQFAGGGLDGVVAKHAAS